VFNGRLSGDQTWEHLEDSGGIERIQDATEADKFAAAIQWVDVFNAGGPESNDEMPPEPLAWLRSKGFHGLIDAGVMWGAPHGHTPGLMIPIHHWDMGALKCEVAGVQVRTDFTPTVKPPFGPHTTPTTPKYVTRLIRERNQITPTIYSVCQSWHSPQPLIITEDYLSAKRLSKFAPATPLYSTSCTTQALLELSMLRMGRGVVVWLDNDNQTVLEAAARLGDRLRVLVDRVRVNTVENEPTKYTDAELATIVGHYAYR